MNRGVAERVVPPEIAEGGAEFRGSTVRSLAALTVLAFSVLAGSGCALFKKSDSGGASSPAKVNPGGPAPVKFPGAGDPLLNGGNASDAKSGAILAGRVLDGYGKPPANTSIRLVSADVKDTPNEVAVTPDGYFTIQGLKPGTQYKLVTRGKAGEKMVASVNYLTAPNVRVLIQLREDFATSGTPDPPGSPAYQQPPPEKSAAITPFSGKALPTLGSPTEAETPPVSVPNPSAAIAPPPPPVNPTTPNQGTWVPGVADKGGMWPPTLDVPGPKIKPPPAPLSIPSNTTPAVTPSPFPTSSEASGPARVPSCVLVGKQLVNFALNDLNGEPWEYRSHKRAKVTLLDFWSTSCVPCLQTVPSLRQLQAKYGGKGFEIIGVADERDGTPQEHAFRVNSLVQKLQINYRQLLGGGVECPVRNQLGVRFYPTLILLDQNGWILWRHEGRPDRNTLDELERIIQRKLTQPV